MLCLQEKESTFKDWWDAFKSHLRLKTGTDILSSHDRIKKVVRKLICSGTFVYGVSIAFIHYDNERTLEYFIMPP